MDNETPPTIHPLVQLMVQRMQSHPEEFTASDYSSRWTGLRERMAHWTSDAENQLLYTTERQMHLDHLHTKALDELLNGEERRAHEAAVRKAQSAQAYTAQAARLQNSTYANQLQGLGTPSSALTGTPNPYLYATQPVHEPTLQIGKETLTESILGQIKKVAGL